MTSEAGTRYEVEAVVFDMDGVLIDSRTVIENAWRDVARRHGRVLASADIEHHVHGRAGAETVRLLFPDHTDDQRAAIWAEVDELEEESPYQAVPGADALVLRLAQEGVPLALATAGWPRKIENALGRLGILHLFDTRVTRDDVTRGKPHPDPYLKAFESLGSAPARTLVFEDSLSGVTSAVAAGAVCVGIGGDGLRRAGAVAVADDFTGLLLETDARGAVLTGLDVAIRFTAGEVGAHV
ncbi:hydrolase [Streptomyces ruber]|uniref:Hydrolase n=2 Tax=Streptomyces TaxID=1883 RepID=A0A918B8D5_9ACTN|nr:HAD family phosphatase [Streptomyces ruber]GGQ45026.1 hydrolase [Streptomyces ruber]